MEAGEAQEEMERELGGESQGQGGAAGGGGELRQGSHPGEG